MIKTEIVARQMCDQYFYKFYINILAEKESKKRNISKEEGIQLVKSSNLYWAFRNKNLKYFIEVSENFSARKEFTSGEDFINSILNENFVYPPQLVNENNWKIFLRNKNEFSKKEQKEIIVVANNVKKFFVFLNGRSIENLLNNVIMCNQIISDYDNDNLDLTVLCFSKKFKEFSEKEGMIIDFKQEQCKIKEYKKIIEKIKEKLNDDFFEEE